MNRNKKRCKVVFIMLSDRPYHCIMANLLLEQIASGIQDVYETNIVRIADNKESLHDVISSVICRRAPDVLITIGEQCTIAAKSVVDEMNNGHPIIFVGVRDPLYHKLIDSYEKPNGCFTGVVRESAPILAEAEYFSLLYPTVRTVLVPYSENDPHLLSRARELKRYLTSIGMNVFIAPINANTQDLVALIKSYVSRIKGLIFLEGCYSNSAQAEVAFLCWQHEIIFFGSGLYAIDNGAACALGGQLQPLAEETYKKLRLFWEKRTLISSIPVTVLPTDAEFLVNINSLRRLDIATDEIVRICSTPKVKAVRILTKPFRR